MIGFTFWEPAHAHARFRGKHTKGSGSGPARISPRSEMAASSPSVFQTGAARVTKFMVSYSRRRHSARSEFTLNAPTENSPSGPNVAALGNDQFVATWYVKTGGGDWNIVGRSFAADGTPTGSEFTVNTTTDGFQAEPDIAYLGGVRFAVTWYSVDDGVGSVARVRVFNADGSAGPDFAAPAGDTSTGGRPAILALPDGQFVVA